MPNCCSAGSQKHGDIDVADTAAAGITDTLASLAVLDAATDTPGTTNLESKP